MQVLHCIECLSANVGRDWLCDVCRVEYSTAPTEPRSPHPLPCGEDVDASDLGRSLAGDQA